MTESKSENRDQAEKYENVVSELLEQISERNKRIALPNSQMKEREEREKKMNDQLAILSEQVTDLTLQLSAINKFQKMIGRIRRSLLPIGSIRDKFGKK